LRSKFAILNFIASLFRNGVGLVLGLITTPIILGYLGEEQFAIFRILLDWFSHLSLLEFGLYGAMLSFLSKIIAGKKDKLGISLQVIFKKYTHVLLLQLGCLLVFSIFYRYLVPVSSDYSESAWWAFLILSTSTFLIYGQIFKAYLEASQRGYIVSYVIVAQNIMYLSLAICFVYLSYGVIGQVVAYVISLFFMTLLNLYICRETLPLFFSKEMLVQEDLNVFKKQRKNMFLNELFRNFHARCQIGYCFLFNTEARANFATTVAKHQQLFLACAWRSLL
jgi:O-antigen/teichoic acid export membrane protein